ncbi:MAG: hemerythrin domain-containing protein [Microbacterium pygmaeum]
MPATPLPASGDAPRPAKTCDASGMAMIHRFFRRGFGEAPGLVRGVRPGDAGHAEAVAVHLDTLSVALHAHHEGEDERLWSTLDERSPACGPHVARMKEQHQAMLAPLNDLDAALPTWRTSAGDPAAVLAALDGINAALAVHLPDEETTIVPVMEHTLTQKEVDWFSTHGRAATPKGQTWNMLGDIMAAQPDAGAEFLHELPPPARLLWRWRGKGKYERNRAVLEGS